MTRQPGTAAWSTPSFDGGVAFEAGYDCEESREYAGDIGESMAIIEDSQLRVHALPGLEHRTVGGAEQGVRSLEVWKQTLAPGAATPMHRHACDEVIVVLSGHGEVTVNGERHEFGPDTTLVVEPDAVHQLVNTGSEPMLLVAALGMAPVRVRTESGDRIPLPWDAPDPVG
jgi:quercetin dioxygenase-like cupin family protein